VRLNSWTSLARHAHNINNHSSIHPGLKAFIVRIAILYAQYKGYSIVLFVLFLILGLLLFDDVPVLVNIIRCEHIVHIGEACIVNFVFMLC
jgi:hypothetical protein